jgi:hypothetical protein
MAPCDDLADVALDFGELVRVGAQPGDVVRGWRRRGTAGAVGVPIIGLSLFSHFVALLPQAGGKEHSKATKLLKAGFS